MTKPQEPFPDYTRRSETESICMYCFQTVKTDRNTPLEEAERIHSDVCLHRVGSEWRNWT
jgi:hypothetical protein